MLGEKFLTNEKERKKKKKGNNNNTDKLETEDKKIIFKK